MVQMLERKISSCRYPMQELHLNYPTTKGKIYSEEEDRYLLCRLHYYGLNSDDVYERIKKDISEFPVFRFDWFLKSRTALELQRRCATLLGMIAKEQDDEKPEKGKVKKEEKEDKAPSKTAKKAYASYRCVVSRSPAMQKRTFEEAQLDDGSRASTPKGGSTKKAASSSTSKKRKV